MKPTNNKKNYLFYKLKTIVQNKEKEQNEGDANEKTSDV